MYSKVKKFLKERKNFKIKVNPEQSEAVQRLIFKSGGSWRDQSSIIDSCHEPYLYYNGVGNYLLHGRCADHFKNKPLEEIILEEKMVKKKEVSKKRLKKPEKVIVEDVKLSDLKKKIATLEADKKTFDIEMNSLRNERDFLRKEKEMNDRAMSQLRRVFENIYKEPVKDAPREYMLVKIAEHIDFIDSSRANLLSINKDQAEQIAERKLILDEFEHLKGMEVMLGEMYQSCANSLIPKDERLDKDQSVLLKVGQIISKADLYKVADTGIKHVYAILRNDFGRPDNEAPYDSLKVIYNTLHTMKTEMEILQDSLQKSNKENTDLEQAIVFQAKSFCTSKKSS